MKTVVVGPPPAALTELIEARRANGLDRFDEVWEGAYHMAPAPRSRHAYLVGEVAVALDPYARDSGLVASGPFNLGEPDDYRIPDWGYHRVVRDTIYLPSAAVVVEILSPDDETYEKLAFYAAHGVDEVLIIDPEARQVHVHRLEGSGYIEAPGSGILGITTDELAGAIDWR